MSISRLNLRLLKDEILSGCPQMRILASHGTLYLKLFLVAVIAASMNAELNYVQLETDARNLIGNEEICNKFDVVILGDVFYDSEIAKLLIPWLKLLLKHDKVVSFFDEFLRCIRKASFLFFHNSRF